MEAPAPVLTPNQGWLEILDHTGDSKLIWDRHNRDEVDAAQAMFDSLTRKRYLAFQAEGDDGRKGKQISKFDPNMERIIMVPPMVGG